MKELDQKFIREQVRGVMRQLSGSHAQPLPTRIAIQHMGDKYDEAIAGRLRERFATVKVVGAGWFWISEETP